MRIGTLALEPFEGRRELFRRVGIVVSDQEVAGGRKKAEVASVKVVKESIEGRPAAVEHRSRGSARRWTKGHAPNVLHDHLAHLRQDRLDLTLLLDRLVDVGGSVGVNFGSRIDLGLLRFFDLCR
jgi:hypothetical protein